MWLAMPITDRKRERGREKQAIAGNFSARKTASFVATAKQLTFEFHKHVCVQHYEFYFLTCFELQINYV